jgi:hypothetical protein
METLEKRELMAGDVSHSIPAAPDSQIGIFRSGQFFLDTNRNGYEGELPFAFGLPGDKPIAGDWDGDGKEEAGIFRNGMFVLDRGVPGYTNEAGFLFGLAGDQPIAGDWNGDGKDEVGIFRNGMFVLDQGTPGYTNEVGFYFGIPGDKPIAGDWNGDGKDEVGIYRNGMFVLDEGSPGYTNEVGFAFGLPGDQPFAGDWNGDGKDEAGVFRSGQVFLDTGARGYQGESAFQFGLAGDSVIAGNWMGKAGSSVAPTPPNPGTATPPNLDKVGGNTADRIELSFANVAAGTKIKYDPMGGMKDELGRKSSAQVNVRVDDIGGRLQNNPTSVQITLYWSKSGSTKDILSAAVRKEIVINRLNTLPGKVIPVVFQSSKFTRQPQAATHLIAVIESTPQLRAEETNNHDNIASHPIRSAKQLAFDIQSAVKSNRITLANSHATSPVDRATAFWNINQVASGQLAQRTSGGVTTRPGSTELDPRMLATMLELSKQYRLSVSELAGGIQSSRTSPHYDGLAFSINLLNGRTVSSSHPDLQAFTARAKTLGANSVRLVGGTLQIVWTSPLLNAGRS